MEKNYSMKTKALLRFLYEAGCVSEEVLCHIFISKKRGGSFGENYDWYRRKNLRYFCNSLVQKKGLLERFPIHNKSNSKMAYGYFLSHKGYHYVKQNLRLMEEAETEGFGDSGRQKIISNFDIISNYRQVSSSKMDPREFAHDDYVVRLKYCFMFGLKKRTILCDLLHKDNALFTRERCDLLVDSGNNEFVEIEYEKSEKTTKKYLGFSSNGYGKKVFNIGIIRARQRETFLPKPFRLKAVIVITENTNILNVYLNHIQSLMTPTERSPRYEIIDKFFLASRTSYQGVGDLFLNARFIHCRRKKIGHSMDYGSYKLSDIFKFKNTFSSTLPNQE